MTEKGAAAPAPMPNHSAADDARLRYIIDILQEKKALDILLMDLRAVTDTADFFVLCSGTSDQHVRALADELVDRLRAEGQRPWHVEGLAARRWILLDFVDVVVHVFSQEAREFYSLERLWGDADLTPIADAWAARTEAPASA